MSQNETSSTLAQVLEIIQFEQWVRFYYIREAEGSALAVDIPESVMKSIEQDLPHLAQLAMILDKEEIDYKKSCETVCSFIGSRLDTDVNAPNRVSNILDGKDFKIEMYLFNLWMKSHEELLDQETRTFPEWREMYAEWLGNDQVAEYRKQLVKSGPDAMGNAGGSVQQRTEPRLSVLTGR